MALSTGNTGPTTYAHVRPSFVKQAAQKIKFRKDGNADHAKINIRGKEYTATEVRNILEDLGQPSQPANVVPIIKLTDSADSLPRGDSPESSSGIG